MKRQISVSFPISDASIRQPGRWNVDGQACLPTDTRIPTWTKKNKRNEI